MKHTSSPSLQIKFFISLFVIIVLSSCDQAKEDPWKTMGAQVEREVHSLFERWYPLIVDTVHGGYWTNLDHDWKISHDQVKMLVTQARGLWTAARGAEIFPEDENLVRAADHGYRYLTEHMWDTIYGGFHQYVPLPDDSRQYPPHKMIYGNAFALYALSQYAKINPQPTVTDWISKVLEWMEETAHDPQHGGYFNLITPDARSARSPGFDPIELYDAGWGAPNWKDQNSSIHLLEALTTTYQVLPDSLARERLEEMLLLVRDTMVRHSGSLHLYFQRDWTPVSHKDSSRSYIIENLGLDHISFGHDIETAFLLLDASKTLYGDYDGDTKKIAKQMVDHTLDHGFDDNYEGMFDRGYLFNDAKNIEILNRERIWWAEAEAWHTLTLMSHQYPNDPRYRDAALSMWNYIQSYQIDSTYGGWYSKGIDLNPESEVAPKGNQWKGCYHDGRSLMQVHLYLNREIR